MKKIWIIAACLLLLTGCGAQETFENVNDLYTVPVMAQMQQLYIALPEEAAIPTMENADTGRIYLCDGYALTVQIVEAGDMDRTMRQITGFAKEKLALVETDQSGAARYDCVWTAAGEDGDQIGRAVVLDDGKYHYTVTVMANAETAGQLTDTWQKILKSVSLVSTD